MYHFIKLFFCENLYLNCKSCFLQSFYSLIVYIDIVPPRLYGINLICAGLKFELKNPAATLLVVTVDYPLSIAVYNKCNKIRITLAEISVLT